ncbi:hypothetical protein N9F16_00730 [bacterium]|jgi:hypothetical protein|nr:hypothetical protein [bacterium]|tara:strand:- start:25 stop:462 length:438 start_codon:yes stop_codon:yes gene_type:complete
MTKAELRDKIQRLAKDVYKDNAKIDDAALAYDELTKFPELKAIIVDLLTVQFDEFLESIDWVSPRPTTFRINLLNGQNFILIFTDRSWIAQVEGKKYYLLNLDEEERAAQAISRILAYGKMESSDEESEGGGDDVDVDVDIDDEL